MKQLSDSAQTDGYLRFLYKVVLPVSTYRIRVEVFIWVTPVYLITYTGLYPRKAPIRQAVICAKSFDADRAVMEPVLQTRYTSIGLWGSIHSSSARVTDTFLNTMVARII